MEEEEVEEEDLGTGVRVAPEPMGMEEGWCGLLAPAMEEAMGGVDVEDRWGNEGDDDGGRDLAADDDEVSAATLSGCCCLTFEADDKVDEGLDAFDATSNGEGRGWDVEDDGDGRGCGTDGGLDLVLPGLGTFGGADDDAAVEVAEALGFCCFWPTEDDCADDVATVCFGFGSGFEAGFGCCFEVPATALDEDEDEDEDEEDPTCLDPPPCWAKRAFAVCCEKDAMACWAMVEAALNMASWLEAAAAAAAIHMLLIRAALALAAAAAATAEELAAEDDAFEDDEEEVAAPGSL